MKTTLSALLLLGLLATTAAQAHPGPEPIVSTDGLLSDHVCYLDGLDGDGHHDHIGTRAWVNVDVLDQNGQPCLP